ncbi:MAG: diadenylate cyclase [Deltaproteobacteria bacterium]|nr:MAG: diadenylate cyclase [Deltaproteobacteria bacterium]
MTALGLIPIPSWRDILDILFLTLVTYHLYVWFRESRALRVLIGLAVLGGIYSLAKLWGLFLTTRVFQILWQVLLILLLILFQSEIRQVLEKVSPLRFLRTRRPTIQRAFAEKLARVVFDLAAEKTGALIVIARDDNPAEFIHSGQTIMALPEPALIKSIFNRQAPVHDGAVVISQDRLTQMGGILPLSEKENLPEHYGTRHRAALGLSERTDAVCLVVSEERSEVSTVADGELKTWETSEALGTQLIAWLGVPDSPAPALKDFMKGAFIENWRHKLGALGVVIVAWFVLASQQDVNISIAAPIQYVNLSHQMALDQRSAKTVNLKLSGRRNSVRALKEQDVRVQVDLKRLSAGNHLIKLAAKNIDLPLGVKVESVTPQEIRVILKPPQPGTDNLMQFK